MPAADSPPNSPIQPNGVTKFINCRLVKGDSLVPGDLLVSNLTGTILDGQEVFYTRRLIPDRIVDLAGRILSPGLIDVQFNGAYGFDFSTIPEDGPVAYGKGALRLNKELVKMGVTSYLPTITSQMPEVYQKALPFLGPSGHARDPHAGSESLGAHVEGPFLSPAQHGCHSVNVLRTPHDGLPDLRECYGPSNLESPSPIKLITIAPELPGALECIRELTARGITASIGHSDASFEEANQAMKAGAKMITHLFNAMKSLHHRNPGIFGLLGTPSTPSSSPKPYFGVISDGVHLHPTSVKIAWNTYPEGMILVSDAMKWLGLPDGTYSWTNNSHVIKKGYMLTLEETGKIAGCAISLIECVSNFLNWTGATIPEVLKAVTETPARMLGLEGRKGSLEPGSDADLVILDIRESEGGRQDFIVDQVWKFGEQVYVRDL